MTDTKEFAIENKALDVLDAYNIEEPVVDVVKIAKEEGVQIKEIEMPEKFSDVAGFYNPSEKTIYVRASDQPWRKLFTVAHELGHIFLEHKNYGVLYRIPKSNTLYRKEEQDANLFAASLLVPEHMLKHYMEKLKLTKYDYEALSKIFGVSYTTMRNILLHVKA